MSIAARLVLAVEDTAQILVSDVQGHCGAVPLQLLAETVAQTREPLGQHAQRQIRAINVAGADMRGDATLYHGLSSVRVCSAACE
jgi:hypothetical protein